MKAEFRAKFLQFVNQMHSEDQGFTVIELLVTIIIVGMLSALALPSFLNQSNKARHSEARTYVGAINRSQQAYFLEKNAFANLPDLQLGLSNTFSYTYSSTPSGTGMSAIADTIASPAGTMSGFAGRVWLNAMSDGTATSWAIVCEGKPAIIPAVSGTVCPW